MRRLAAIVIAGVISLAMAAPALARYDDVGSGATRIALSGAFVSLMQRNGVKLSVRAPAKLRNGVVTFPAVRGKFDPLEGKATVEHDGALLLKGERGFVSFKALQLKTTRKAAPLAAKVGGGQLELGSAGSSRFSRRGFGASYQAGVLRLAPKVVARLDKRLHLQPPAGPSTVLGTASSDFQPAAVSIVNQGQASLELDPAFAAKLDQLHVAVNPIFPAERPGPFTFEIFGGRLAPGLGAGQVELRGGLDLVQLGGGEVQWIDPRLDFGSGSFEPEVDVEPSPPYAGRVGPIQVAGLSLAGATVESDPRQRTISLARGGLGLSGSAAATLNEVFAKPQGKDGAFGAGEPMGWISFSAKGQ